jgi:hypothetical protein
VCVCVVATSVAKALLLFLVHDRFALYSSSLERERKPHRKKSGLRLRETFVMRGRLLYAKRGPNQMN